MLSPASSLAQRLAFLPERRPELAGEVRLEIAKEQLTHTQT
jgi:hypothetical protein